MPPPEQGTVVQQCVVVLPAPLRGLKPGVGCWGETQCYRNYEQTLQHYKSC